MKNKIAFVFSCFFLFFISVNLSFSQCKITFCTCCEGEYYYEIYKVLDNSYYGSFVTDEHGCSIAAGINHLSGTSYYVQEANPLCDQITRVYYTACVCGEETMTVMVPCCESPADKSRVNNKTGKPQKFVLSQNFPNPFNPATKIDFQVPEESNVKITIFDITGKVVEEILNANVPPGYHSIIWNINGKNIASGVYFYKMEAGSFLEEKKMVLIK